MNLNLDKNNAIQSFGEIMTSNYQESNVVQRRKEFKNLLQEGSSSYFAQKFGLAAQKYKKALQLIPEQDDYGNLDIVIIKYMICKTLLETNDFNCLKEALGLLHHLEAKVGHFFPTVYCAIALINYKFSRYDEAISTLSKAMEILNRVNDIPLVFIPETKKILRETTKDGLKEALLKLHEWCLKCNPPDALCCMANYSGRKLSPSHNQKIYFGDPDFAGLVTVFCSQENPCILKFHMECWKLKVQEFPTPVSKDWDVLGLPCFHEKCAFFSSRNSVIAKLEIMGQDRKIRIVDKKPLNVLNMQERRGSGALDDSYYSQPNKVPQDVIQMNNFQNPAEFQPELTAQTTALKQLRAANFGVASAETWRPDKPMYGNSVLLNEYKSSLPTFEISEENSLVADKKLNFLKRLWTFVNEKGPIKVNDLKRDWQNRMEIFRDNDYFNLFESSAEMIDFLLQTKHFAQMDDLIATTPNLPYAFSMLQNNVTSSVNVLCNNKTESVSNCIEDDNLFDKIIGNDYKNPMDASSNLMRPEISSVNAPVMNNGVNISDNYSRAPWSQDIINHNRQNTIDHNGLSDKLPTENREQGFLFQQFAEFQLQQNKKSAEQIAALNVALEEKNSMIVSLERVINTLKAEKEEYEKKANKAIKEQQSKFNAELLQIKRNLLKNSLENQYHSHNCVIQAYIKECNLNLSVVKQLNNTMERVKGVKTYLNPMEWSGAHEAFMRLGNALKTEFEMLNEKLDDDEYVMSLEEIKFSDPQMPRFPNTTIQSAIHLVFSNCLSYYPSPQIIGAVPVQPRYNVPPPGYVPPRFIPGQYNYPNVPNYVHPNNLVPPPSTSPSSSAAPANGLPSPPRQPLSKENSPTNRVNNQAPKTEEVLSTSDVIEYEQSNDGHSRSPADNSSDYSEKLDEAMEPADVARADVESTASFKSEKSYNSYVSKNSNKSVMSSNSAASIHPLMGIKTKPPRMCKSAAADGKKSMDKIMSLLRKKYTGVSELDLLLSVTDVKTEVGSLSGMKMKELAKRAKYFINKRQAGKQLCYYNNINNNAGAAAAAAGGDDGRYQHTASARQTANANLPSTSYARGEPAPDVTTPSSKTAWEKVEHKFDWKKEDDESECVICMESMEDSQRIPYTLRCQHSFHEECIRNWLKQDQSCPTCRVHSTMDDEFPPLRS